MKTFNNLEECVQEIKRLRVRVDALIQIANENKTSAETTLAWRELQLAKAWLGELLGDVSKSPSPYIGAKTPDSVPRQDVAQIENPPKWSTFDMCTSQRNSIDDTLEAFRYLWFMPNLELIVREENDKVGYPVNFEEIKKVENSKIYFKYDYYNLIQNSLQEARFWYGFEIANLRTI